MNYEAFAAMFANDYMKQKAASGANIGYKKKADLKPAVKEELKTTRRPELAVIDDKLSRFGSTEPPQVHWQQRAVERVNTERVAGTTRRSLTGN